MKRLASLSDVVDEPKKGEVQNQGDLTLAKRVVRARVVARVCMIAGLLAAIPAFFLPGTYPLNPRLEPRSWYVVGGDWLGIGIALLALGILIRVASHHFDSRHPS